MKSPFPGMDPYIEACGLWGDFHTHLIEKIYELQPMINAIYQRSRYERSIDYSKPLTPPLDAAATAWLEQQLKSSRQELR